MRYRCGIVKGSIADMIDAALYRDCNYYHYCVSILNDSCKHFAWTLVQFILYLVLSCNTFDKCVSLVMK